MASLGSGQVHVTKERAIGLASFLSAFASGELHAVWAEEWLLLVATTPRTACYCSDVSSACLVKRGTEEKTWMLLPYWLFFCIFARFEHFAGALYLSCPFSSALAFALLARPFSFLTFSVLSAHARHSLAFTANDARPPPPRDLKTRTQKKRREKDENVRASEARFFASHAVLDLGCCRPILSVPRPASAPL